jgi:hypothetical protein
MQSTDFFFLRHQTLGSQVPEEGKRVLSEAVQRVRASVPGARIHLFQVSLELCKQYDLTALESRLREALKANTTAGAFAYLVDPDVGLDIGFILRGVNCGALKCANASKCEFGG